ncbi:hypothetical protein CLOP_g24232 [Closterium sp. NIES-67]|nr:hypothetical protein CLOP_g24232 [Closterium sp. NIES-67]
MAGKEREKEKGREKGGERGRERKREEKEKGSGKEKERSKGKHRRNESGGSSRSGRAASPSACEGEVPRSRHHHHSHHGHQHKEHHHTDHQRNDHQRNDYQQHTDHQLSDDHHQWQHHDQQQQPFLQQQYQQHHQQQQHQQQLPVTSSFASSPRMTSASPSGTDGWRGMLTSAASAPIIKRCHSMIQRRELPKGSTPYIISGVFLLLVLTLWFDVFSIFQADDEQALIRASASSIPPQFSQSSTAFSESPPSSPAAEEPSAQHTDTGASLSSPANTASEGFEPTDSSGAEAAAASSSSGSGDSSSSSISSSSPGSGLSPEPDGGDVTDLSHPSRWQQHAFRRVGLVSFAQFSAYRISGNQFAAVGLAARALDDTRKVGTCVWEPAKSATGQAQGEETSGATSESGTRRRRRRRLMAQEIGRGGKEERHWGGARRKHERQSGRGATHERSAVPKRESVESSLKRKGEGEVVAKEVSGRMLGAPEILQSGLSLKRRQLQDSSPDDSHESSSDKSPDSSPEKSPESESSVNGEKPGEGREREEERKEEDRKEEGRKEEERKEGERKEGERKEEERKEEKERKEEGRKDEERKEEEAEDARGWIRGEVEMLHVGEHHWWKYAGLILLCTLKREAYVADGGRLHMRIDGEDVVVYEEQPGEVVSAVPHPPFLHNITHCSPPIHHEVNAERIHQWMDLHIRMGVDHYAMYDVGGVDDQLRSAVKPFLDGGIVEITDFREVVNYESWYYGQVMIVNDCVYRFRSLSKWIMYLDYDEFMFIDGQERLPSPFSVHDFLSPHEGMPYVSHGCLWWDHERCLPSQGDDDPRWALERMLWHWPFIYCQSKDNTTNPKMCLDHWGHRKLFVDPRKVRVVENHVVSDPSGGGKDLPTDSLRHHHFHGIIKRGLNECNQAMKADDPIEWWAHGTEEADRMQYVRTHPLDMPSLLAAHKWWREYVLRMQQGR